MLCLTIFRRYLTTFQRFSKIGPKAHKITQKCFDLEKCAVKPSLQWTYFVWWGTKLVESGLQMTFPLIAHVTCFVSIRVHTRRVCTPKLIRALTFNGLKCEIYFICQIFSHYAQNVVFFARWKEGIFMLLTWLVQSLQPPNSIRELKIQTFMIRIFKVLYETYFDNLDLTELKNDCACH